MRASCAYLSCLLSISAAAQHAPGGVRTADVWRTDNVSLTPTVRQNAIGITAFQVVIPTDETESATLTSGRTVMTSRRVAEPSSGQYVNFATGVKTGVPQIVSVRRRVSETDTAKVALENLPLAESSDSICETIVYQRMLSHRERQRVDTYLALKYGVTLDQATPTSYVSPQGRTLWDAVGNARHSHHIAGLCNDTISGLYAGSASNAEASEVLRLSADTITPASYVICGDDGGTMKYIREGGRPKRLGRSWRIATSGNAPERIAINFNAEQLQEAFPLQADEHYWLAIDDTAYVKSAELGVFEARFDSVHVHDGMTFTIVAAKGDDAPELEDSHAAEDNIYAVNIAPNPTTDGHVNVRIRLRDAAPVTVSLHGLDGRRYATQSQCEEDYYGINITLPSHGVWIATMESGDSRHSYKLISK